MALSFFCGDTEQRYVCMRSLWEMVCLDCGQLLIIRQVNGLNSLCAPTPAKKTKLLVWNFWWFIIVKVKHNLWLHAALVLSNHCSRVLSQHSTTRLVFFFLILWIGQCFSFKLKFWRGKFPSWGKHLKNFASLEGETCRKCVYNRSSGMRFLERGIVSWHQIPTPSLRNSLPFYLEGMVANFLAEMYQFKSIYLVIFVPTSNLFCFYRKIYSRNFVKLIRKPL